MSARAQEQLRRWRTRNERDPAWPDVLASTRDAIEVALERAEGRELTRDARTLLSVLHFTTGRSKLWDAVYLEQLVAVGRIGGEYAAGEFLGKHTADSLRKWADRGVLVYEPGRRQGEPSIVGLPGSRMRQAPLLAVTDGEAARAPAREPLSGGARAVSGSPPEQQQQFPSSVSETGPADAISELVAELRNADIGTEEGIRKRFSGRLSEAAFHEARDAVRRRKQRAPLDNDAGYAWRTLEALENRR